MNSGILDIERRIESAALENLQEFEALTNLLAEGSTSVIRRRDASLTANYPCAYAEAYNMVEFGLHTGAYMGGLRLGGLTYKENDKSREIAKQITGAFRAWSQQTQLVTFVNGTTSAHTSGQYITFWAIEMEPDSPAYMVETESVRNYNEAISELMVVCRPSIT